MEKENTSKSNAELAQRPPPPTLPNSRRHPFSDLSNATASSSSLPSTHHKRQPRSRSKSPRPPSPPPSGRGDCNLLNIFEQTTVYTRKTTSRIDHTPHATSNDAFSCPPRRTKTEENKGKKSKTDDNNDTQRVVSSAPCKRRKKPEKFTLPEDFVREQRDYFAKLDEEELVVEEAEREPFQFLEKSKDEVNQSEDG